MSNHKVIIEHDRFSRKPIFITFKCSLVHEPTGSVLHSTTFKERSFFIGLVRAERFKRHFLQPHVIFGLQATEVSEAFGFKIDLSKGADQFFLDMLQNASVEFLVEYQKRTKNIAYRVMIQQELKMRGEDTV